MYDSLSSIWKGWRRIYLHAFQKKPLILSTKVLNVILLSILPFLLFIPLTSLAFQEPLQYGFTWGFSIPVLFFIVFTAWKTFGILKADRSYALLHPIAACFITLILMDALWMAVMKRKTRWR